MKEPTREACRIRGRLVDIEIGEATGIGWVAVGIVREGLASERGRRFQAQGANAREAERRLVVEIEAFFG